MSKNNITSDEKFRIGSLNILNNVDKLEERMAALVHHLKHQKFDALALQEVLGKTETNFDVIGFLQEELGFDYSFTPEAISVSGSPFGGNSVLSKHKFVESFALHTNIKNEPRAGIPTAVGVVNVNGRDIHILSCHFTWGGDNEWVRLRQAEIVDAYAKRVHTEDNIILLMGDLNTVPDSSTLRYLYGLQEGTKSNGTLWVDSWKMFGHLGNEITSNPDTQWGKDTAAFRKLIFPEIVPQRRIDYLLSYEWCYGRHGSPLSFVRFADKKVDGIEISDHYGVGSDIYVPKK